MIASTVLVTGANGFVGRAVVDRLLRDGDQVHAAVREAKFSSSNKPGLQIFKGLDLAENTDWSRALHGVDAIVHCAARVHMMQDSTTDPLAAFRQVNVAGTLSLARQAAAADVKRFVFVSSIKVNGEHTDARPFEADDTPAPDSDYGQSKLEAELALADLGRRTGLEVTVVRPVLVYGPGAPGNFRTMLRVLQTGAPLPLGAVHNLRSLVALDNLADLLALCVRHPAAAGQVFLTSDGDDVSTTTLLRRMGTALGKPARLFAVPETLIWQLAKLLGKQEMAKRLLGSLRVDISKTRRMLGWSPPLSMADALVNTMRASDSDTEQSVAPARSGAAP